MKTKTARKKKVRDDRNTQHHNYNCVWLIEGDAEADWLKRIGLGSIVSQIESVYLMHSICIQ